MPRYIAQGPSAVGYWWVLDRDKGKFGTVFKSQLIEAEARQIAAQMNEGKEPNGRKAPA